MFAPGIETDRRPLVETRGTMLTRVSSRLAFPDDTTRKNRVEHNNTRAHSWGEFFRHPNGCNHGDVSYATDNQFPSDGGVVRGVFNSAPHFPLAFLPVATAFSYPQEGQPITGILPVELPHQLGFENAKMFYGLQIAGLHAGLDTASRYPTEEFLPLSAVHVIEKVSGKKKRPRTIGIMHATSGVMNLSDIVQGDIRIPSIEAESRVLTESVTSQLGWHVQENLREGLIAQGEDPEAITVRSRFATPPFGYVTIFNGINSQNMMDAKSISLITATAQAEYGAYEYAMQQLGDQIPSYLNYEAQVFDRVPFAAYRWLLHLLPYDGEERLAAVTAPLLVDNTDQGAIASLGVDLHKGPDYPAYPSERIEIFRGNVRDAAEHVLYELKR